MRKSACISSKSGSRLHIRSPPKLIVLRMGQGGLQPQKNSAVREFLTIDELKVLIHTPCRYDIVKRAFLFSCFTGLRYSDMQTLKWSEIHQAADGKTLYIEHKQVKTRHSVTIPLSDEAMRWIPEKAEGER